MLFGEDVVTINPMFTGPCGKRGGDDDDDNDDTVSSSRDLINDIRPLQDFRSRTFSNFKKQDARHQLLMHIHQGNIEEACYWSAEFVCAADFQELWELIIACMAKNVQMANLKLPLYLEIRYNQFKDIVNERHFISELDLRNNGKVRGLFAEIVSVLACSDKSPSYDMKTLHAFRNNGKQTTTTTTTTSHDKHHSDDQHAPVVADATATPDIVAENLKAVDLSFAEPFFHKEDQKQLFVAMNELAYHLICGTKRGNLSIAFYWIDWMIAFQDICNKTKPRSKKSICFRRPNTYIDDVFQKEPIWVLWDCLFTCCRQIFPTHNNNNNNNTRVHNTLNALHRLFCVNYRSCIPKKRRFVLYFATTFFFEAKKELLLRSNEMQQHLLVTNEDKRKIIDHTVKHIHVIYKQIKKNELAPRTDYLFTSLQEPKTEFERSIAKLHLLNQQDLKQNKQSLPSL